MKLQELSLARDPDLRSSFPAMQRAAELAHRIAMQTDTGIVIVENQQIVHLSARMLALAQKGKPA